MTFDQLTPSSLNFCEPQVLPLNEFSQNPKDTLDFQPKCINGYNFKKK